MTVSSSSLNSDGGGGGFSLGGSKIVGLNGKIISPSEPSWVFNCGN